MSKISKKTKLKALKLFKQGCKGKATAKRLGLNPSSTRRWCKQYEGGNESWVYCTYDRRYEAMNEQVKEGIVLKSLSKEETKSGLCRKYALSISVLNVWIRNYTEYGVCTRKKGRKRKGGHNDGIGTEEDGRAREARKATAVRAQGDARRDYLLQDVLPNLRGRGDGSVKKKVLSAVAEARKLGVPVTRSLKLAGICPSTYYYWEQHKDDSVNNDVSIASHIRQIQEETNWSYGIPRMTQELKARFGYVQLNHKRVERVMKEHALNAKVRIRRFPKGYYRIRKETARELPQNILARDFSAEGPMCKLVTDITYLRVVGGWLFLAAVKDLYDNGIVSYVMEEHQSLAMVIKAIQQLVDKGFDLHGVLIHSDRGWTYTNRAYVDYLRGLGVVQSMSRRGNCWDNACIENFFGLMKCETIYQNRKRLLTKEEMEQLVREYIAWYNDKRIQKKLGYRSPVQYRQSVA
ncbi:IS3 family transposase [uncultured Sphaerochaeta sp.]|uniref:IS3 family transposase n=1 Tax=uncultured Sphaerochaeta sp. TaxID=886478 RepID=UPI002A0A1A16|nr:IS3 family transposase [uncultured Sphaerochaeta sp.]